MYCQQKLMPSINLTMLIHSVVLDQRRAVETDLFTLQISLAIISKDGKYHVFLKSQYLSNKCAVWLETIFKEQIQA